MGRPTRSDSPALGGRTLPATKSRTRPAQRTEVNDDSEIDPGSEAKSNDRDDKKNTVKIKE